MRSFWSFAAKDTERADLSSDSLAARAAAAGVRRTQSWKYGLTALAGRGAVGIGKVSKIVG